ncbi:hypothetical protein ACIBQ6_00055 [Nonomuraea sp. NPDC049655]|uniref:hypothetical protein n=1 Tax=Nonomuraea sp. NPDC049655 TaxID=3364355 RepID=UPI003795E172
MLGSMAVGPLADRLGRTAGLVFQWWGSLPQLRVSPGRGGEMGGRLFQPARCSTFPGAG